MQILEDLLKRKGELSELDHRQHALTHLEAVARHHIADACNVKEWIVRPVVLDLRFAHKAHRDDNAKKRQHLFTIDCVAVLPVVRGVSAATIGFPVGAAQRGLRGVAVGLSDLCENKMRDNNRTTLAGTEPNKQTNKQKNHAP